MIDYETFSRIAFLHEKKGLRAAQIARELGLDERTVRKGWRRSSSCRANRCPARASSIPSRTRW